MKNAKPAAKGGQPTPPGALNVPGGKREAALKGAPQAKRVEIDKSFVSSPNGGKPLVLGGGKTLHVRGNHHVPR
jgi:hypothetical protein